MTTSTRCPGCGLELPRGGVAPYDGYYLTSAECWSIYTEVLGVEFGNALVFGRVHQLTVDTYALQHAGGPHPDKSIAVHLVGLHLALEKGVRSSEIAPHLQRLAALEPEWPHFEPPRTVSAKTVFDIALTGSPSDHVAGVRTWAAEAWEAWSFAHPAVAAFAKRHLAAHSVYV